MSKSYAVVFVQFILLLGLGWCASASWPWHAWAWLPVGCGSLLVAWSARVLGRSLTPFPDPNGQGLQTHGPYRWVRHPMYLGVLLCGAPGWLYGVPGAALGAALLALFVAKIRHEEAGLEAAYPGYRDQVRARYALLPGIW